MVNDLLASLAAALDRHRLPYMIIGGQAVLLYGEARFTRDIDLTLGIGTERLGELLRMVEECGWRVLASAPEAFVAKTMVLPCQDDATGMRYDFVFGPSVYEREAIARARVITIAGVGVRVAAPEDLIVHKLLAGRPRDLEDVRGMLLKSTVMDEDYLRMRLVEFDHDPGLGLEERWEQILKALPTG